MKRELLRRRRPCGRRDHHHHDVRQSRCGGDVRVSAEIAVVVLTTLTLDQDERARRRVRRPPCQPGVQLRASLVAASITRTSARAGF